MRSEMWMCARLFTCAPVHAPDDRYIYADVHAFYLSSHFFNKLDYNFKLRCWKKRDKTYGGRTEEKGRASFNCLLVNRKYCDARTV